MAVINSPASSGATTNNYVIQIPVITQIPCQFNVEIFRRSVYRGDNGNPRSATKSETLTHSTVVKIITPQDESTRIRISVTVNGRERNTNPQILTLDGITLYKGIKISDNDVVQQIKTRPLTEEENAQLNSFTIIDTVDPTDNPHGPCNEEPTINKVRNLLNRKPLEIALLDAPILPISKTDTPKLDAPILPISRAVSPKEVNAKENKERTAVSDNAVNPTLTSPKAKDTKLHSNCKSRTVRNSNGKPSTSSPDTLGNSGIIKGKNSLNSPKKHKRIAGGGFVFSRQPDNRTFAAFGSTITSFKNNSAGFPKNNGSK